VKIVFQPPPQAIERWPGGLGRRELAELAVAAEDAGFDAIATTDHPFPPGEWLESGGHHAFDPFVALAFVAARTSRIRLLTNLVVAGYRHPYLTAKAAATVDLLSDGRLILGLGAGYLASEFAVLGAEYSGRGPRFDAALRALRAAWTGESVHAVGSYPADGHRALPRPIQRPGPPIWIGGNSRRARQRAARHAEGWMPFQQSADLAAVTRTDPLASIEQLAEQVTELDRLRRDYDRAVPLEVCFAPQRIGSADALLGYLDGSGAACAAAGVTWLVWHCSSRSLDECLAAVARVGAAIKPQAAGRTPPSGRDR
jgi:probable F420-dependent oxidoreductase